MPPACKHTACYLLIILGLAFATSCGQQDGAEDKADKQRPRLIQPCDKDNGGLVLPQDFCAGIVADSLGFIRHLAVSNQGDIYVSLRNNRLNLGGIVALRDSDMDGRMDRIEKFSDIPGMGIRVKDNNLYFASDTDIYRYNLGQGFIPEAPPDILVRDLPVQSLHAAKPFAIDDDNHIYVNIGATTNACEQGEIRNNTSLDPCPELEKHAGIWRFSLDKLNQTQEADGYRYASGIRNAYAIDWHQVFKRLYIVQHGRDQLHEIWPELYSAEDGAKLPAEELMAISDAGEYGWPYCYFDPVQGKRVMAPEYDGDGKVSGRCAEYPSPLIAFPAHYSPNDLKFYTASQFPARYHNGAFIAFHGSYNRGSFEQVGYQVVFVPFKDGIPAGNWEIFADGFAGIDEVSAPEDADYRPTGLAIGPDGSLYIADSVQGRIWRVLYIGNKGAALTDNPDK